LIVPTQATFFADKYFCRKYFCWKKNFIHFFLLVKNAFWLQKNVYEKEIGGGGTPT
jgi:hypothetical protein